MRRLSIAVLLVTACVLPLTPGCAGDEVVPQLPLEPSPDGGSPDGGGPGGTPDAGPGDTTAPGVVSANPAEGTTGLYPVEVYYRTTGQGGLSQRKVFTVQFTEPMDTSITQASLFNLTDPSLEPRLMEGTWSTDGQTLTLLLLQPEEGGPVLEEENAYAVDLKGFKDLAGNLLDATHAGLGDGRLDFKTGPTDHLLNHACGHTLVDTVIPVEASATPTGTVPRTDQTHKYYEVTVPMGEGTYSGYTRLRLVPETPYILFLDQDVSVALSSTVDGTPVEAQLEAASPACPGITHRVRFTSPDAPELRVRFTTPGSKLRLLLEESI
ncbi:Ig-like domain-containing protein [Hyalangium rubrum]|uniref:Ig-like domain-containing protein n=1 Tax=Hyalangium rubrum TaxID=3103134 RepID=A0ABU5H4J4_9BACT|nr:Ig-like domain-containing protein [Hyalangium sp. s54d21]MDY7228166.1 Ig-like domain-containing protein [Hyalangium sp. s54d21]